jgi:tetrahydromethanopterin S-methyltransferase subunit B
MPVEQGWALIGLIGVLIVALLTLVTYSQRSLKGHFDARLDGIEKTTNARFDAVNARIDAVVDRLDRLDRDVQALVNRIFRSDT